MIASIFTGEDEVLIFAHGPNGPVGKEDFSDRDWDEYDEAVVELPVRISFRGFRVDPERVFSK